MCLFDRPITMTVSHSYTALCDKESSNAIAFIPNNNAIQNIICFDETVFKSLTNSGK